MFERYLQKSTLERVSACACHLGVMPPDEYNKNVDNSVYTNTVAKYRCVGACVWARCMVHDGLCIQINCPMVD